MKKTLSIIAAVIAGLSFFSCEKPAEIQPTSAIEIVDAHLIIPAKGGEATVMLETNGVKFTAEAEKSWLSVSINDKVITCTADVNDDLNSRYSKLTVKVGDESRVWTVQQLGLRTSGFEPSDIIASADASVYTFPYTFDEKLVATCDAEWVTLEITEDMLKVSLPQNETPATADNKQRTAEIAWELGYDKGVISVVQRNADFMKEDANWTVTYDGVQQYQGEDAEFITNTVADATISGKYSITYFAKSDFDAAGLSMPDYIDQVAAPKLIEAIEYAVEYYKSYGYDVTFGTFLYEETDYEIFDIFDAGDYYAAAIGLNEDAEATGHYAVSAFTKKSSGGGDTPTGYDAWLGDWEVLHGTSTTQYDTWTVSVKENGSTYYITGIEGYTDLKIEAMYDSSNNSLVAYAQQEIGTKTVGGEECPVGFYAATSSGNFWTPGSNPYTVFEATFNGSDAATINPVPVNTSDGEVTPELALYIATTSEGSYKLLKKFADATKIPGAMRRPSGSGGGDDNPGNTGYESWIGQWTDVAGSTWTVTEKVKGESYTINGIEGQTTLPLTAEYDASAKTLIVRAQSEIGTVESSSYGVLTVGYFGIASDGYFYTPNDPSNAYAVFTATLSSDGKSANLVGDTISTSDGDVDIVKGIYIGESSEGNYYSITKAQVTMPSTITKVGGGNGGGDDNPGSGSDAYNKFLGNFTVTPGDSSTDPWTTTIKQNVADQSFKAYAWQGWEDDWMSPADADFADGAIVFKGGTGTPAATNVQIDDSGTAFNIYYMGRIEYQGDNYVITSGTSMYDCCSGTVDADGNIVLTGLDVEISSLGQTFKFVDYSIVAMDDAQETIYTFRNMMGNFPVTMTKSNSGSSVKTLGLSMKNAERIAPSHVIRIADSKKISRVNKHAVTTSVSMNACEALSVPSIGMRRHMAR